MENAVAGRDWLITTVAGEKLSNQIKKIATLNSRRKVPGIHLQTMLQGLRRSLQVIRLQQ